MASRRLRYDDHVNKYLGDDVWTRTGLVKNVFSKARVAIALLKYSSEKEVADFLGTSTHTVRTQVRAIYAKLGVDTRARFVKLMMGLARRKP